MADGEPLDRQHDEQYVQCKLLNSYYGSVCVCGRPYMSFRGMEALFRIIESSGISKTTFSRFWFS